ncbi:NUDIX hydrolase, partial [Achromobacter sp.]|uniref:NUDIX hydrolase n=1 Tax=Achromobacter sp. TaxID=134375 RepID=UPI0031D27828
MTAKSPLEYFPAPRRSHFCSQCGSPVNRRVPEGDNRERDICDHCGAIHYQNPRLVVGTVPVWENRILLCRRAIEPRYNTWTLPAGFMELGESTAQGAARETLEESGAKIQLDDIYTIIDVPQIEQVHVFYLAQAVGPELDPGPESLEARWYDESE